MLKEGLYDFMGNTVEYYAGEDFGYDLDSGENVPVGALALMGEFIREFD